MKIPAETLRLFPNDALDELECEKSRAYVVTRLLESGDSADLEYLLSKIDEELLRRHLRQRGGRQIDRRSRAFWSLLLGVSCGESHTLAEDLWPL